MGFHWCFCFWFVKELSEILNALRIRPGEPPAPVLRLVGRQARANRPRNSFRNWSSSWLNSAVRSARTPELAILIFRANRAPERESLTFTARLSRGCRFREINRLASRSESMVPMVAVSE
jgi:hypothetical protein